MMSPTTKMRSVVGGSFLLVGISVFMHLELKSGFFVCTLLNNGVIKSAALQRWLEDIAAARLLIDQGEGIVTPVSELAFNECTPGTFLKASMGGTRPVVVRGAHTSSAILQWDVETLLRLFGNETSLELEKRIDPMQPSVTFGERLRMYQRGAIRQVNQVFFPYKHRKLRETLYQELGSHLAQNCAGHGDLVLGPIAMTVNVYRSFSNVSSGVAWHAHNIEAPSTVHVRGRKTWTLVSPQNTPLMRPESSLWGAVLFAQGNPYSYVDWDPIAHLQPMIDRVPRLEATVEAGDVLFVPAGWWHNTENERSDTDIISLVFSHFSIGPTLVKSHPPYAQLAVVNLAYVAGVEVVEFAKTLAQYVGGSLFQSWI
eukprot:TRINITY_DN58018_c0_g1_i1.p1 TRINITY_DN58018_c0_g1~~TRINITY_DN58018_c0_g1_i1.p1  ORF type:complete len:370 (-),score=48.86 TRINITY_DN58018_c0_g1_i1:10-1119(-)